MSFVSPPNPQHFNLRVWEIVRQIPPGRVMAYGQVGALIPPPRDMTLKDYDAFKARWVGGAMLVAASQPGDQWSARARPSNASGSKPRACSSTRKIAST